VLKCVSSEVQLRESHSPYSLQSLITRLINWQR